MFDRGISVQTLITAENLESQLKNLSTYAQVKFKHSWLTYLYLVLTNEEEKLLDTLDTKHKTRALRCLDGTRMDLIRFISEWVRKVAELACNILWIFGYPGAGKSTLAMHVANLFRIQHRLGVIVEFNRNTGTNAADLWKTIVYALAYEYPECRKVINL